MTATTPSPATPAAQAPVPLWRLTLWVALAYGACGQLAVLLSFAPSYAAPLYPSAGLALAVALVHGLRALPGVALGAFAVNLALSGPRDPGAALSWLLPATIAVGATLQAGLGAALLRRLAPGPLVLGELREALAFCLVAGLLSCTISATVATLALDRAAVLQPEDMATTWWTWWAGDALGVVLAAPIVLSLIGRPREDWAPRRLTLAVPLAVTGLLLAGATVIVGRWDAERTAGVFERDAQQAAIAFGGQLTQGLHALEAVHGVFYASEDVSLGEFSRAVAPWLAMPLDILGIGHAERVPQSQLAAYQARVAAIDGRPLRIFDRRDDDRSPAQRSQDDALVIRYLEPGERNAAALGLNILSVPAGREAAQRAVVGDMPAATSGFRLTQVTGDETGVVVYKAIYSGDTPSDPALRPAALRGLVFVSLRLPRVIASARRGSADYLEWCLVDLGDGGQRQRLTGLPGCERRLAGQAEPDQAQHHHPLPFAGRHWELILSAPLRSVPDLGRGNAWLFSMGGLIGSTLLTALLLTVTGRTRRIETAVTLRTAELRREVAERERTESALRDSERRLRNIVDQAPVGIVYADLDGRVREANPRLRQMLGMDPALAPHRSGQGRIVDLMPADDRAEASAEMRQRARLQHHDGQVLWVQTIWRVLRDEAGQPLRLVGVLEDITDHLRRQEAEQGRALAESANRAKNEFLSRMSHELRTPLNAMLGFAQLLELDQRPALSAHQAGWAAQILAAGWHLLEMINDTLDLSRIESGQLRLDCGPVALDEVLAQSAALVQAAAERRGIRLQQQLAPDALRVRADATRLKQVLTNLLSNAVKYNIDGGQVLLQTRRLPGAMIELRISDTGPGFSPEQLAQLFQPFNRLGREHQPVEGTGIGLVISRGLAELMGGSLQAEPGQGQGATFVLTLPALDHVAPPMATSRDGLIGSDAADAYRRRRVHCIEDNETNIEVLRGILLQRPQVRLTVSTLGLDGLAAIRQQRPDLILLDMHLPDIDGLELLRQLQRDPASADIPVMVVSADATRERVQAALAAGARHYLTKPLDLGRFLGLLDELLGSMDTGFG
ncbi:MAG: CHASE domain-containing protein [Burkholderiaceae bacterium]|nr:CHASE domain-containing protein [Burkholderiaceae bacterium]